MTVRVLHVIDSLGPGGSERSLAESLPLLAEAGVESIVVYRRDQSESLRLTIGPETKVVRLSSKYFPALVLELRRLIESTSPDLVHTTLFEATLLGRLAAVRRVPVLTSLVNTPYASVRLADPRVRAPSLRFVRLVDGLGAQHLTAHFHAVSEAVKRATVEALSVPAERITVIERGRNPERLGSPGEARRRRARTELKLSSDDEVVVNVGRHDYQKGQRYLIDAVGHLASAHPRLRVLIVGRTGHVTSELERACRRLGVADHVRVLGHRDDVPEILAAADVFAFPSLWEGIGGAAIEAMALGLPVVASDIPAMREVLAPDRNATLVPPADGLALATAISELLTDRLRATAYGATSRAIFESRFTLDHAVTRMVHLYCDVATLAAAVKRWTPGT